MAIIVRHCLTADLHGVQKRNFFGGRAGQQEEKADSRAYFMYLLLYVFMMATMFVCCGASV